MNPSKQRLTELDQISPDQIADSLKKLFGINAGQEMITEAVTQVMEGVRKGIQAMEASETLEAHLPSFILDRAARYVEHLRMQNAQNQESQSHF